MNSSLSKKIFWLCFFGFTSVSPSITFTQESYSTQSEVYSTITDPAQNRLFWMSTGRTMPAGKFSISDFEVFILQLGYAPTDFFHFNFSYLLPLWGTVNTYWSVGGKAQILKPNGIFQGLSIGADLGFFNRIFEISSTSSSSRLVLFNVATSVGNERLKGHISILKTEFQEKASDNPFPTFLQLGSDIVIVENSEFSGIKIIAETFFARSRKKLSLNTLIIGFRLFGKNSSGEFAWPLSQYLFDDDEKQLKPWQMPYVSISILF